MEFVRGRSAVPQKPIESPSGPAVKPVRSPSGNLSVVTTERGLPLTVRIDSSELTKPPTQLASELLALCRLSAARAQQARRQELAERGTPANVIRGLWLATDEDVARLEQEALGEDDAPVTWMRSV
jgi:hypothetical protein